MKLLRREVLSMIASAAIGKITPDSPEESTTVNWNIDMHDDVIWFNIYHPNGEDNVGIGTYKMVTAKNAVKLKYIIEDDAIASVSRLLKDIEEDLLPDKFIVSHATGPGVISKGSDERK